MDAKQIRPQAGFFEQMALDLQIEEEPNPSTAHNPPSLEEARLRSEAARQLLEISTEQDWMTDYHRLRDAGWPWRVAAYIAWASSPRIGRQPGTLAELATQVLGLTSGRQVHHWRETNPAIDEVVATLQAAPLMEHRADVFRALALSASDSDHRSNPDRKLFLELTGDYTPKLKVDGSLRDATDLSQLSEEELALYAGRQAKAHE